MHAEHPSIHDRPQGQVIKDLTSPPPYVATAVLPLALVIESINLGDLSRLVVPSDESHAFRVSDFQCQEKEEGFDTVEAPVNKVA